MNVMFKIGSIFALFVTISKVLVALGISLPVVGTVAIHSSFLYGIAIGVIASGFTRKLVLILIIIAAVYFLLSYAHF